MIFMMGGVNGCHRNLWMQPQSCTPRVKAAPPTRWRSKFMGPLGGSIYIGAAPGALHSSSYIILDINMLKET